jgi:hypothetical protein
MIFILWLASPNYRQQDLFTCFKVASMTENPKKRGRPQGSTRYADVDDEAILRVSKLLAKNPNLSRNEAIRRVTREMQIGPPDPEPRIRRKYTRRLRELMAEWQVQNRSFQDMADQSTVSVIPEVSKRLGRSYWRINGFCAAPRARQGLPNRNDFCAAPTLRSGASS